jgi:hypothetical protein
MLTYAKALPKYLPDFQRYLLAYPNAKSEKHERQCLLGKGKVRIKSQRCASCRL